MGSRVKAAQAGRAELKIPKFEPIVADVRRYHVFGFFHDLWQLNGFDVFGDNGTPQDFQHELIVPAAGNKPVTIIRGSFSSRTEVDQRRQAYEQAVAYEASFDEMFGGVERDIVTAEESYSIVVADLGKKASTPTVVLSADWTHTESGMAYFMKDEGGINANGLQGVTGQRLMPHLDDGHEFARNQEGYDGADWTLTHAYTMHGLVGDAVKLLTP